MSSKQGLDWILKGASLSLQSAHGQGPRLMMLALHDWTTMHDSMQCNGKCGEAFGCEPPNWQFSSKDSLNLSCRVRTQERRGDGGSGGLTGLADSRTTRSSPTDATR
jgi:hypothetical protein